MRTPPPLNLSRVKAALTQGDKSGVQLSRGAGGHFPRGRTHQGEEGTEVRDGQDRGVGRRQQKMLVVTEDVEKPSGWFVVCGVLILPWVSRRDHADID